MSDEHNVEIAAESTPPASADQSFGLTVPEVPPSSLPANAPKKEPVPMGERGIQLRSLKDLAEFSRMAFDSGLAPRSFKNVQAVAVAVQKGMEHGLSPLAALSSVYVVNGMPAWTGKAALGLVLGSGLIVPGSYRAWIEGDGEKMVATVESQRVAGRLIRTTFSVADAKAAKLWNKKGRNGEDTPWVTYPKRMLLWRAISFHLNDNYPDVLGGAPIAEEAIDIPAQSNEPRKSLLLAEAGPGASDGLLSCAQADGDSGEAA